MAKQFLDAVYSLQHQTELVPATCELHWGDSQDAERWLAADDWGLSPVCDNVTVTHWCGESDGDGDSGEGRQGGVQVPIKVREFSASGLSVGSCAVLWTTPGRFDAQTYATVCAVAGDLSSTAWTTPAEC